MDAINPGYSNFGTPFYWKNEQSGKLKKAVMEFFSPYAETFTNIDKIKELSPESVSLLRRYLIYYYSAPCWRENPDADSTEFIALNKLVEKAKTVASRKDIMNVIDDGLDLGLDPF